MRTKISNQNSKLGKIPNISLTPIKSCVNCKECKKSCYALKAYRMYPNVRNAWDVNLDMARNNHTEFFNDINTFIAKKKPSFFRWHVAGDILGTSYLTSMIVLATNNPTTKFLAFTKNHKVINDYLASGRFPDNFTVIMSGWPKMMLDNPYDLPVAWLQDGTETRVPKTAINCPGKCDACGMCWELPKLNKDVVFNIH